MSILFDRIVIAVPDLAAALAEYELLLGVSFWLRPTTDCSLPTAWVALTNTVLELQEQPVDLPQIVGFVLADASKPSISTIENERNLSIALCDGSATQKFRVEQDCYQTEMKVDHLVLYTADADACVSLFQERLGLRLALDKDVPKWGGRMLFFRSGKFTLEVIEPRENQPEQDNFWGIAYQCADINQFRARLDLAEVSVSTVRDGRKPNTKVATVKSHHLGIPTLLVQPAG